MSQTVNIRYIFTSLDDILQQTGEHTCQFIQRLSLKYISLRKFCSREQKLLAVSLAWAFFAEAENGNAAVFRNIHESMHLRWHIDSLVAPPDGIGCRVMVNGTPFYFGDHGGQDEAMELFFWDSFALMLEPSEDGPRVEQCFYDIALRYQWKAFEVNGEFAREQAHRSVEYQPRNGAQLPTKATGDEMNTLRRSCEMPVAHDVVNRVVREVINLFLNIYHYGR